ncbi:unnamed protein product, partial [Staurois parvus]
PQAVTPSYTREYTAALLRDPCSTYLVLRSRDVSPAVSPAISSGRCIRLPCSGPCERRDVRGTEPAANLKILKIDIFAFHIHCVPSALSGAPPAFLPPF